jgi:hypothetical protein
VPESTDAWPIEAYDDQAAMAETLVRRDCVAVQSDLTVTARGGPEGRRIVNIAVIASQFLPLRHRSPNKLPIRREQEEKVLPE